MTEEKRKPQPTVMYRGGEGGMESRTFDHPDDVPPNEGWVDSPTKVSKQARSSAGSTPQPTGSGTPTGQTTKPAPEKAKT